MKKADIYKKINRNNRNICNHINRQSPRSVASTEHITTLVSSPDVSIDPILWFNDDITTGVQIIELNSSDNPQSLSDDENEHNYAGNMTHAWNHVYNDRFDENQSNYEENKDARDRRRIQNRSQYTTSDYNPAYSYGESNDIRKNVVFNHQMNCFTILDNHHLVNPDSSSEEEYANIEETQCDNTVHDWNYEDFVAYEPEQDMEKRTIWIYSYKNKHLLSDDEFELVNIPSREISSTSSSLAEIEGPSVEYNSVPRVETPIPSTYVPKLILPLTPTLPTVTEVTEPKRKSSSNQTDKQSPENVVIKQKPVNNWFTSENVTSNKKLEKSFSVVDWMALSPREKRRRFRNASPIIIKLPTVNEVSSVAEGKLQACSLESIKVSHGDVSDINAPVEPGNRSARTRNNEPTTRDSEDECTPEDRGDYNKTKRYFRTPQIRYSPKPVSIFSVITDPIETREEGDCWVVKRTRRHHNDEGEDAGIRSSGDMLLIRNMSLLRPAHWAEYLPLSASRPSLPLSCNTISEEEPQSWLTRIANCFRCCK